MESLTWKEWFKNSWLNAVSGLILFLAVTGLALWVISLVNWKEISLWWLATFILVLLVFYALLYFIVKSNKNDLKRCLKCRKVLVPSQYVDCPNCGKVCPKCGKPIEKGGENGR